MLGQIYHPDRNGDTCADNEWAEKCLKVQRALNGIKSASKERIKDIRA